MSDATKLTTSATNASGALIAKGEIVRFSATNAFVRAQADALANYTGIAGVTTVGVPATYPTFLAVAGEVEILLEGGLAPAAGEELYLSATQAGRATNVAPATAIIIGVVKSAVPYASTGRVVAILDLEEAGAGGGSVIPANVVADWDLALTRYFLVDNENGDDGNVGFIDAAPGSVLAPAGIARRTVQGLFAILPKAGAGRSTVVLFRRRGEFLDAPTNYLDDDGLTESDLYLQGIGGYRYFGARGSSDLTNSAADRLESGACIATTGPNADGSYTVAPASTLQNIDIAAGALPAEPGILGMRLRFITGARTGEVYMIQANDGTSIQLDNVPADPVDDGDTFVVDQPGVLFRRYVETDGGAGDGAQLPGPFPNVAPLVEPRVGIALTASTLGGTALLGNLGSVNYAFFHVGNTQTLSTRPGANTVTFETHFRPEELAADVSVGSSRIASGPQLRAAVLTCRSLALVTPTVSQLAARSLRLRGGLFFAGLRIDSHGNYGIRDFQQVEGRIQIGSDAAGTTTPPRFVGPGGNPAVEANGCVVMSDGSFELVTGAPCVRLIGGQGGQSILDGLINGAAGGNDDVGIEVVQGHARIGQTTACSASGTAGEIRIAGNVLTTYAALALTNVVDEAGNDIQGTAGHIVDACRLVTNQEGGALVVGNIVKGNGTSGEVELAQADTEANAEALGVMVTPPADGEVGYMATAGAPYVLYDAAPTPGAIAYLNAAAAGEATTTVPPLDATEQKLRLGRPVTLAGDHAYTAWHPENLSTLADGNP